MKVIICRDYEQLSVRAANHILNQLALKPASVFGLATGSTPLGAYQEIINRCRDFSYDFSTATTFNLDEYCLPGNHRQNYRTFMRDHFFGRLTCPPRKINFFRAEQDDYRKAVREYRALLRRQPIDLQLLGLGSNGHIAFNEPGSSITSKSRRVALSQQTITDNARFFKNPAEMPRYALTMGISEILRAKKIIILANGRHKAEAVRQMLEGKPSPLCPASYLQTHPDVTVILDQAAAALLKKPVSPPKKGWGEDTILTEAVIPKGKKILVVSPHHDDSAVSCGATLSKLAKYNQVTVAILSDGSHALMPGMTAQERTARREQEAGLEGRVLGVKTIFSYCRFYNYGRKYWSRDLRQFANLFRRSKPDIIILTDPKDNHPTHALSTALVLDFFARRKTRPEMWFYEGLWSQHLLEEINLLFAFGDKALNIKNQAINCHRSQARRLPLVEAAARLARFRALTISEQNFINYGEMPFQPGRYVEAYFRQPRRA